MTNNPPRKTVITVPNWPHRFGLHHRARIERIVKRLVREQVQRELAGQPPHRRGRLAIVGEITLLSAANAYREHRRTPIEAVDWLKRRGLEATIFWKDERDEIKPRPAHRPGLPAPTPGANRVPRRPGGGSGTGPLYLH